MSEKGIKLADKFAAQSEKARESNIELFRIVAMLLIVAHFSRMLKSDTASSSIQQPLPHSEWY